MAFTENLSQFFAQTDFADQAVITLPDNSTRNVSVIFNTPTQEAQIYGTAIETDEPFLMCKTADLAGFKIKTGTVTINGKTYKIERSADDGTGISTVHLKS